MRPVAGFLLLLCLLSSASAQQSSADSASVVPTMVNFTGVISDASGKPLSSLVGITFSLYKDSQGGAPLWLETQNVQPDRTGHYSAILGSTTGRGLSSELFVSDEARWLGVQVQGEAEQPRVLLLSVPYALKAKDAETLGGIPASAFLRTPAAIVGGTTTANAAPNHHATMASSLSAAPSVSGSGTKNFIPIWTSPTALGNSALFQSSAGNVGLATISPTQKLEVDFGNLLVRGANNFKKAGDTAFLYVGDTSHPIEGIWNTGLALGAYLAPQALFIQDRTGYVGVGIASPTSKLDVVSGTGSTAGTFVSLKTGSTGLTTTGGPGSASIIGGAGFVATGGPNKADGGTAGAGGVFTGGTAAGNNILSNSGAGGIFQGGPGPHNTTTSGGPGLISVGGSADAIGPGGGGDGGQFVAGSGVGGAGASLLVAVGATPAVAVACSLEAQVLPLRAGPLVSAVVVMSVCVVGPTESTPRAFHLIQERLTREILPAI